MAGRRRLERKTDDRRPVVTDDFIYDDPQQSFTDGNSDPVSSDTPEEAVRKLRKRTSQNDIESEENDSRSGSVSEEKAASERGNVYSSGIRLDENLQPVYKSGKKAHKPHPLLRGVILTLVTLSLLVAVAAFIFHRIYDKTPYLDMPENAISAVVSPVQSFFSGLTETVFGYFRSMKLRANIEEEYNKLVKENEELVYKAMQADQLKQMLSEYEDLTEEVAANRDMMPLIARVTAKSDSNYFSTFTIDKGSDDGVEQYMAVTYQYSMIGYVEEVHKDESTVRTIIDSGAHVAAIIDSTRDQGVVRGTLGLGTGSKPQCWMNYLPDESLPRPGDLVVTSGIGMPFPKGIPIGTVEESTRGMDANKQYIVITPSADFQHLERVIVLMYKPKAGQVEAREENRQTDVYTPMDTARPVPPIQEIASDFLSDRNDDEEDYGEDEEEGEDSDNPAETVEPTPDPTETPSPTPILTPTPDPTPYETPLQYNVKSIRGEPTPSPTPTFAPTATPYFTPDPEDMTFEEE